MPPLLLIFVGGGLGASLRYLTTRALLAATGSFWAGTLAVNISGSLLMGLLAGWGLRHGLTDQSRMLLGTGILGGFTTFSAFSLDVVLFIQRGAWGAALLYMLASVMISVAACWLGIVLMKAL